MQKQKRPALKNEVEELKHLLEQKNRELEIEAALECVRIVAMRMNQPSDMIDVCRIISEQLQILKVENIRNVQTAIINDEKGTYLNYEFFTQYCTSSILEIRSNLHPKVLEFVNTIKKSKDAFFTTEFKGKDLKDWIEYRRKTNQNSDPILEKAESVHYYFYSIGPGALGLSTYAPLASRELDVFKRFHKVFMLAYQRFLDLQKAEGQAREAQIEAAMERIRNRALIMKDSRELNEVVSVFFNEFSQLDLLPPEARTYFCDINSNTHKAEVWMTYTNGEVMSGSHFTPLTRSASMKKYYEAWKRKEPISIRAYKGKNLDSYISFVSSLPHVKKDKDYKKLFKNPPKQIFMTDANFLQGNIGIMSFDPLSEEALEVLQRFAKVFEFTYTRFLDLQKAEAQAREAQIEAALERVRAHAMGLRKSSDLHNIITVIFEELQKLGLTLYECSIFLRNGDTREFTVWGKSNSDKDNFLTNYQFYFVDHPLLDEVIRDLERQIPFREFSMEQEELKSYADLIFAQTAFRDSPQEYKDSFYSLRKVYAGQAIFQHGFLEAVGTEPLPGDLPEVLRRFSQVIDLTYTRFLDLQKAETQTREAEIQLALERVRARTMAMQHSDELSEAAFLLVQQVRELAIKAWGCAFHIYADNENGDYEWFSNEDGYLPFYKTPRKRFFREFYEMRESGETLYVKAFKGKACENHYKYLLSLPVVGDALKDLQSSGAALPSSQIDHVAYFKYGYLLFITYNPVPEAHEIFKRFAKEFEQTYTRFLDLQKAEAQAREAEIQLALERVRARTMAMHKSDELSDTASVMFQELKKLGIKSNRTGVCIFDFDKDTAELWLAAEDGDKTETMVLGTVSAAMHPIYKEWIEAGKLNKKIVRFELAGDELINYYKIANAQLNLPKRPNTVEQEVYYGFIFSGGSINIIAPKLLTEEELDIGYRFANVFGLLYRRFLDLQKAETQAREAQIEAALERVRSRTMAMQDSNELQEVAALMYEEFIDLGFDQVGQCGYAIIDVINNHQKMWLTQFDGNPMTHFNLPLKGDPLLNNRFIAWESKKPFLYQKVKKSEFSKHLKGVQSGLSTAQIEMARQNMPDPIHFYNAYFNHGYLHVVANHQLNSDQESILLRFTLVFEQTYTRFLDLKKAEAQAREAQIEAALERIRTQTMAMQHSDELINSTKILFEELGKLDLSVERSGIGIFDEETKDCKLWTTIVKPDGSTELATGITSLTIHPLLIETFNSWKLHKPCQYILEGEELKNYYKLVSNSKFHLPKDVIDSSNALQKEYYLYTPFGAGGLYVFSNEEQSNKEKQILRRFAEVFHLTYTRFEDLQKAEAQTREAVKQASLDRVRGEIASMRSKEDLKRITPLIWQELTNLNVSFIRCGVLIMDEENNVVQTHLSTPDGKTLGIFNLPADSEQITNGAYTNWKEGEIFQEHWNKSKFIRFMQSMIKHGRIDNPESYQGAEAPPESLYLNFLPFKQGMLYVGNTEPLSDEHLDLAKSLANALSIAYARYEDFNQLEAANNQIQKALDDLRSTQTQLVHAEKMASLGELTAGIAHEIQNPLNFVNNFSEVSKELIEELREERAKQIEERDVGLEEEIIEDIIHNLEKINHHGQRASSIVKGMLEHSRSGNREKELTDINNLADEYLRLSYHGLRAKDKTFNAEFKIELDPSLPKVKVIGQDIGRVLLNLINNAFYAVSKRVNEGSVGFKPEVLLRTKKNDKTIEITVQDNGGGIPKNVLDKIFQPFFTTKPAGQGTGLGLSLSYDIITKGHDGHLEVETQEGIGSTFCIQLPIK